MSRFIDVDKIDTEKAHKRNEIYYRDSFESGVVSTLHLLAKMPTADVVEVVRCKNCKHIGHELRFRKYSCKLYQMPYCSENDFCSYGKRKDT